MLFPSLITALFPSLAVLAELVCLLFPVFALLTFVAKAGQVDVWVLAKLLLERVGWLGSV